VGVVSGGRVLRIVGIMMLGKRSSVDVVMDGVSYTMVGMIGVARARAAVLIRRRVNFMVGKFRCEMLICSGLAVEDEKEKFGERCWT
jgi:hypothetical protein